MSNETFQEKYRNLFGKLYGTAIKLGLSPEDAEDLVQDVFLNVYQRIEDDQELAQRFKNESKYFENYVFLALQNRIINLRRDRTVVIEEDPEPGQDDEQPAKERWISREVPLETEDVPLEEVDPVMEQEREKVVKKIINEIKNGHLSDQESEFLDLWLELAKESGRVNIAEIERRLGLNPGKGHDIFQRIKRRFDDYLAKDNSLKDVAASAAFFDLRILGFIGDILKPEECLDDELIAAGERIFNNVFDRLGIDAIKTLSKFK